MGHKSNIEWTSASWNPWQGCHKVSQGCKNCYMFRDKARYGQDPNTVVRSSDKTFYAPLKWAEPRTIFTCSWSDFFIEEADAWRDEAFAIMALTPQHTYQVLTKRPERMLEYFRPNSEDEPRDCLVAWAMGQIATEKTRELGHKIASSFRNGGWPLPNVWLGVSVEDQKTADERIPLLLQTPAAVRWLSMEPLLGPVDLTRIYFRNDRGNMEEWDALDAHPMTNNVDPGSPIMGEDDPVIDWVVTGGESGPNARPTHPDWIRSLRDQCQKAGVPHFFKQWGEYRPVGSWDLNDTVTPISLVDDKKTVAVSSIDGDIKWQAQDDSDPIPLDDRAKTYYVMEKVGKKKAGRLLDGREWNEMPEVSR